MSHHCQTRHPPARPAAQVCPCPLANTWPPGARQLSATQDWATATSMAQVCSRVTSSHLYKDDSMQGFADGAKHSVTVWRDGVMHRSMKNYTCTKVNTQTFSQLPLQRDAASARCSESGHMFPKRTDVSKLDGRFQSGYMCRVIGSRTYHSAVFGFLVVGNGVPFDELVIGWRMWLLSLVAAAQVLYQLDRHCNYKRTVV